MKSDEPGFTGPTPAGQFSPHDQGMSAAGSAPSRSSPGAVPLTGQTGLPGIGTVTSLKSQADPGTATTTMPGQNDLGISGADADPGYTDSGAGHGSTFADQHRQVYQQKPAGES